MSPTERADALRIGTSAAVPGHVHGTEDVVADHGLLLAPSLLDDDHPQYLNRSGVRPMTGNLAMGGKKITGLGDGSASGDSVHWGQVHAARNNEANKIVRTNGSGYLDTGYINYAPVEDKAANPSHVFGLNSAGDRYLRDFRTANLQVDYAVRTGHGGQVFYAGTTVLTTTASGTGTVNTGVPIAGSVVMANGDFGAHQRAATLASWSGTTFTFTNVNASQVIRINWVVC